MDGSAFFSASKVIAAVQPLAHYFVRRDRAEQKFRLFSEIGNRPPAHSRALATIAADHRCTPATIQGASGEF
jgi:hypothetical protein